MKTRLIVFVIAVLVFYAGQVSSGLYAQDYGHSRSTAGPVANAVRTDVPPTVDGVLNESIWGTAPAISGFVQHEPMEGQPPTERTEIRIAYDQTAVYIGARMFDSDPGAIRLGENRRDAGLEIRFQLKFFHSL